MQPLKRFVYASTIHVYGDLVGHLDESSPTRVKHPYGFTHQMSEQLFEYGFMKYKIPTTCLRFSNVFGAPANLGVNRWSLLVNDLCRQAVETRKLLLKSPNSQRDFIAMPDACMALERAIIHPDSESSFKIFNISSAKNMSVLQMAELIAARARLLFGTNIKITIDQNGVPASGIDFQISNSKAGSWGWTPTSDFAKEIDATLSLCDGARHE
jgi:UDP-glucose 4-epimerase